jgi:uncharacterized protein YwqG
MTSLPRFRLIPEPASPEAAQTNIGFEWAGDEIGLRHQLGGSPQWLQGDQTPACPDCNQPMTFYGQLDSVNDEFNLADCGLVYVFVCFDDFKAKALIQSY